LVHYNDLARWASLRAAENALRKEAEWDYQFVLRENAALRKVVHYQDEAIESGHLEQMELRARITSKDKDLSDCSRKKGRPNIAGIAIGFGLGVVTLTGVAIAVL
jgi:hypothetical protein